VSLASISAEYCFFILGKVRNPKVYTTKKNEAQYRWYNILQQARLLRIARTQHSLKLHYFQNSSKSVRLAVEMGGHFCLSFTLASASRTHSRAFVLSTPQQGELTSAAELFVQLIDGTEHLKGHKIHVSTLSPSIKVLRVQIYISHQNDAFNMSDRPVIERRKRSNQMVRALYEHRREWWSQRWSLIKTLNASQKT